MENYTLKGAQALKSWLSRKVTQARAASRPVRLIVIAVITGWLLTVLGWLLWWWLGIQGAERVPVDIFTAWTGELAFFTIVGSVVAVVSLRNPGQEGFLERIRILYGGGDHPHFVVEHNAKTIRTLGGYARAAHRSLTIEEYSAAFDGYKVHTKTEYHITNMFPDVDYEDKIKVLLTVDKFETKPPEIGRVHSVKICGLEHLKRPAIITEDGFNAEFDIRLAKGATDTFVVEATMWYRNREPQRMLPQRAVERFSMDIVSRIDQSVVIETDAAGMPKINLTYGNRVSFPDVNSVVPKEAIFGFKLLPPID